MTIISFKDEGEIDGEPIGACTIFHDETEFGKMRPFGSPLPKTVENLGWVTREKAIEIANTFKNGRFVEI